MPAAQAAGQEGEVRPQPKGDSISRTKPRHYLLIPSAQAEGQGEESHRQPESVLNEMTKLDDKFNEVVKSKIQHLEGEVLRLQEARQAKMAEIATANSNIESLQVEIDCLLEKKQGINQSMEDMMANVQEYESEIRDLAVKKETAAKMMTLLQ
jgi:chromosome segregation ATPase